MPALTQQVRSSALAGHSKLHSATERGLESWLEKQNNQPFRWLALFAALMAVQVSPWWYATPDAASYLSIARSVATSGKLANFGNPHIAYPPGYPILISPAFLIAARPFLCLSIMHWTMAALLIVGLHRWASGLAPKAALLITGLTMTNVSLWIYYRRTLSEFAFIVVLIWTVNALNAIPQAESSRGSLVRTAGGMALVGLLCLIREVGGVLAAGFAVAMMAQARAGRISLMKAMLAVVAVTLIAAAALAGFAEYDTAMAARGTTVFGTHLATFVHPSGSLPALIIEAIRLRLSEIGRLVVPGMFKAYGRAGQWLNINMVVYVPLFILVAFGWWRMSHRCGDVLVWSAPFYFAVYTFWAFDADTRYLLPLLPLTLASLWFVIERLEGIRISLLAAMLAAHLGVAAAYWLAFDAPRARQCDTYWHTIAALAAPISVAGGPALTAEVPQCIQPMLEFELDRPVLYARSFSAAEPDVRWVLAPRGAENSYPGFKLYSQAGGYELLARR